MDAQLITAIGGLLVILGGGIAFVWGKIERRFAAIEAELKQTRADLDACKDRDSKSKARMAELMMLFRMLVDDMHERDPANPLLHVARTTLARWSLDPTPPDMTALLDRIPSVP